MTGDAATGTTPGDTAQTPAVTPTEDTAQAPAGGTATPAPATYATNGNGHNGTNGANGANGDGQYPVVELAFGDASPAPVLTINPASAAEIVLVQLEIEEPFDGVGAMLTVGTTADPDLLMAADQVDPSTTAVFESSPRVALAGGAEVQLTITPGVGASQGRGKLVIQATPTT